MADDRPPLPTAPRDRDRAQQHRGRHIRQAFLVGLVAFVLVAAAGVFGEHQRSLTATGHGYEMTVAYPQATRPGLSSSIEFVIRRLDGGVLPDTLTLETDMAYLRLFDDHAVEPTPDEVRADGEEMVWSLVPEGDATELRVLLAAEAIDLDDVKEAAREEGIADLRDVEVAILNPDGKLAFIRRS